jgi:hypothetical protein
MIFNPFIVRKEIGPQEQETHIKVPQVPEFLENLGLGKLNFEFLQQLFSLLAEFKARFPKLNINLKDLFKIVQENKALFENLYDSLFRVYLEGKMTLEELKTKITEHHLYQKIVNIFNSYIYPYLKDERGEGEGLYIFIAFIGLLIITALFTGTGNIGIGQVLKLEEISKALSGNPPTK